MGGVGLDECRVLKGVCMIMIVIHHICNQYMRIDCHLLVKRIMSITSSWGYLATGLFFILSGFGLYMSLEKKGPSFSYLLSHLWGILFPFLCIFIIDYAIYSVINGFDFKDCFLSFSSLNIAHKDTWFLKIIILYYIVTISLFNLRVASHVRSLLILGLTILYIIVATTFLNLTDKWYITIMNFPVGFLLAAYFDQVSKYMTQKHKTNILIVFLVILFTVLGIVHGTVTFILRSLIFSSLLIISTYYWSYQDKILIFIGKNSIFYYLGHFIVVYTLFPLISSYPIIVFIAAFVVPTLIACIINRLNLQ